MIVSTASFLDPQIRAYPGEGFDGLVRISTRGYYGSGALLFDGRAVLTAAHVLTAYHGGTAASARVSFETTEGTASVTAPTIHAIPSYDPINVNNDLALLRLPAAAANPVGGSFHGNVATLTAVRTILHNEGRVI